MANTPCGCIKGKYDFYINEINCDKILYQDLSLWMEGENYVVPDTYEVEFYSLSGGEKTLIKKIEVKGTGNNKHCRPFTHIRCSIRSKNCILSKYLLQVGGSTT